MTSKFCAMDKLLKPYKEKRYIYILENHKRNCCFAIRMNVELLNRQEILEECENYHMIDRTWFDDFNVKEVSYDVYLKEFQDRYILFDL